MRTKLKRWGRLLLAGTCLFASGNACVGDAIRGLSEDLDDVADEVDGEEDVNDVIDDLQDLFD